MVHSFELNGYRIALDSASGAVHLLSETAYSLLKKLEEKHVPKNARLMTSFISFTKTVHSSLRIWSFRLLLPAS